MTEKESKKMSQELKELKIVMFEELEKLKKLHTKMEIQLSNHLEVAGTIDKYEGERVSKIEKNIEKIEKEQKKFITSGAIKLVMLLVTTIVGVLAYVMGVKSD